MDTVALWLKENNPLLKPIATLARREKVPLYLVGGLLRDLFLKREKEHPDIDFCLPANAISFCRSVSRLLGCGFVVLDKEHGCARAVKKIGSRQYTLDFTDFRGKDLADDLLHRDFTINSMAVELDAFLKEKSLARLLIDPYKGRQDLKAGTVRLVNRSGFDEDPLRILRAFSLSALFGFSIQGATLRLLKEKKEKLLLVSCERIRDELFKVLSSGRAYETIRMLEKQGILGLLFPEINPMRALDQGPYHHLDVLQHSFQTVHNLESIIFSFRKNRAITAYLQEEVGSGHRRFELLKLAALLHDVGKPRTLRIDKGKLKFYGHERVGASMAERITVRYKFSNDETRFVRQCIFYHLRPGFLADMKTPTHRALYRFSRDTARQAASVVLLSLADQRATRGRLTTRESRERHERLVRKLLKDYFSERTQAPRERIVNGHDLMKYLKLPPSPLIGRLLRELEELRAIGKIKTKEQALEKARRLARKP